MANPEHLAWLKKGVEQWNGWRNHNPEVLPDLHKADLGKEDLRRADLRRVNFSETDLYMADLTQANLSEADLLKTNLMEANLSGADVTEGDLSGAILYRTIFADTDLSGTKGLESCAHIGPSTVGIDTFFKSNGDIPENFLLGCGVPEQFIVFARSLIGQRLEYYSCFISYSNYDRAFAARLHADLRAKNVRCWFAPEELKIGDRFPERIEESIRRFDKVLIVLSEASVQSHWVEREVYAAREREDRENREKRPVLFPIRIDDTVMSTTQDWAAEIRRARQIGDFRGWEDRSAYQRAFDRLIRDLTAEQCGSEQAAFRRPGVSMDAETAGQSSSPLKSRSYRSEKAAARLACRPDRARVYKFVLANGYRNFHGFRQLEAKWPWIEGALQEFVRAGQNDELQELCDALGTFLDFSGRWEVWLGLEKEALRRAIEKGDIENAGWRERRIGWIHFLMGNAVEVLGCAERSEEHWRGAKAQPLVLSSARQLRGLGFELQKKYDRAIIENEEALKARGSNPLSEVVVESLNDLGDVERASSERASAEKHYRDGLEIAKKIGDREGIAILTGKLARLAIDHEEWPAAERLARRALRLTEPLARQEMIGVHCRYLAQALACQSPHRRPPVCCPSSRYFLPTWAEAQIGRSNGGVERVRPGRLTLNLWSP